MNQESPISIDTISATGFGQHAIKTFTSYSFERNIMTPSSGFRFSAPGVEKADRTAIRSSDVVNLYITNPFGFRIQVAAGFIDETDTHITAKSVDYLLSGRDFVGKLVDDDAVDKSNTIIYAASMPLLSALKQLMDHTRIKNVPVVNAGAPSGNLLIQTNVGETKMSAFSRYLDYCNCLIWTQPNGSIVVGKPNMHQRPSGKLILKESDPSQNNCLEARVKRNTNQAIRQIATQLQNSQAADPAPITMSNQDKDVRKVAASGAGKSIYRVYSLGNGMDSVNILNQVNKNQNNAVVGIGQQYTLRQIAQENVKVLDVECVVEGHTNENGLLYNIDQIYDVTIEDDDVDEPLYVYAVSYELTLEQGLITKMRLCRKGTIVADISQFKKSS